MPSIHAVRWIENLNEAGHELYWFDVLGKGELPTEIALHQFVNWNKRKIAYIVSGTIITIGLVSLFTNGLNYGVDFVGGRSYVVKFENPTSATEVANTLKDAFGSAPEVKTYGEASQLKVTTKYNVRGGFYTTCIEGKL